MVESLDDDVLIELIDYCMRKVAWLIGLPRTTIAADTTFHKTGDELLQMLQSQSPARELARQQLEIDFRIAVQCVTMLRYVAECLHLLPLSIVSRLLDKHDVLLSLAALIENPPWTYKAVVAAPTRDGSSDSNSAQAAPVVKWKKFVNQKWVVVEPSDLLVLTTTEAQVWIAVYYLLCTKAAREHYDITQFRKDQLLRVRKYLNDLVLDQLPLLQDVQRYLDELSIMQVGSGSSSNKGSLVMEAVPYVRLAIMRAFGTKYASVASRFDALSATLNRSDDLRELAEVYQMDGIDELLDGEGLSAVASRTADETSMEPSSDDAGEDATPVSLGVPRRVKLTFRNHAADAKGTTSSTKPKTRPLIVEITSDNDDNNSSNDMKERLTDTTDGVVVVECSVGLSTSKVMETKTHRYTRYALRVSSPRAKQGVRIACHAAADAQIWFADSMAPDDNDGASYDNASESLTLSCTDVELPAPLASGEKLWKQIGSLQEASLVVVQCQFVALDANNQDDDDNGRRGYRLGALFLSVPC